LSSAGTGSGRNIYAVENLDVLVAAFDPCVDGAQALPDERSQRGRQGTEQEERATDPEQDERAQ
jgi:hypothetical protein